MQPPANTSVDAHKAPIDKTRARTQCTREERGEAKQSRKGREQDENTKRQRRHTTGNGRQRQRPRPRTELDGVECGRGSGSSTSAMDVNSGWYGLAGGAK
eukprot:TRINITY_DN246_c0_g1_i1.p3 TRINITY_DN246_c0_g1~~TRINITY_DN246_c0_g1_i1.p3  ORF type:complete len:100 (+),score=2.29 TRINITY_DN246_c0_g1_i1:63-362(+)